VISQVCDLTQGRTRFAGSGLEVVAWSQPDGNVLVSAPHTSHAAPEQYAWHGVRNQAEAI
jgi:hypothetical protein